MAPKNKNPRNPNSVLFKRLTRIFSGPLVNYRAQFTREERRTDLDKYRARLKTTGGQQFKRSHDNYGHNLNMASDMMRNQNRADRYIDFDQMEYTPEVASALDIYADEMTTSNEYNKILSIHCPNEEIKAVLNSLFFDILNVEFNLFGWARTMCKYGDFFLYLDLDETMGVQSCIGLPGNEMERLEGQDKTNANYVQYQWNSAGMTLENWQVAHFRVLGNDKHAPYGTSVLEPARRIWRQLNLIEDAMLAYRIVRAPARRVFKIDVGNIAPQDVEQYMERVKTSMKRNQIIDDTTGRVDLRYNPLSLEEDYFIPVRGGVGSDIITLPGANSLNDIDDVKYMRDKLFSALKVPQSYLTMGDGASEDKASLSQKDIRFARTIQRLQRIMVSELEKIGVVHLYTMGYRAQDLISFTLQLNNPSKIAELQELEHLKTRFDIAASATEGLFSKQWIARNIFSMSDEEFLRNQRESFYDRKIAAALESVTEDGLTPEGAPGGPLGDLGLGDEDPALPDLPEEPEIADVEATAAADEIPGAEPTADESPLLVAPGRRDTDDDKYSFRNDGSYLTKGSKGKRYNPTSGDGRRYSNKRSALAQSGREKGLNNKRNVFPGALTLQEMFESMPRKDEEENIFQLNNDIKKLITELESKETEK
tara:strand:- start:3756 stop:5708 length:1953 start_codon:yes stop_codon:yes gene_type:complete